MDELDISTQEKALKSMAKNRILSQSSQAMLTQANSVPQQILGLLQ